MASRNFPSLLVQLVVLLLAFQTTAVPVLSGAAAGKVYALRSAESGNDNALDRRSCWGAICSIFSRPDANQNQPEEIPLETLPVTQGPRPTRPMPENAIHRPPRPVVTPSWPETQDNQSLSPPPRRPRPEAQAASQAGPSAGPSNLASGAPPTHRPNWTLGESSQLQELVHPSTPAKERSPASRSKALPKAGVSSKQAKTPAKPQRKVATNLSKPANGKVGAANKKLLPTRPKKAVGPKTKRPMKAPAPAKLPRTKKPAKAPSSAKAPKGEMASKKKVQPAPLRAGKSPKSAAGRKPKAAPVQRKGGKTGRKQ